MDCVVTGMTWYPEGPETVCRWADEPWQCSAACIIISDIYCTHHLWTVDQIAIATLWCCHED